MIFLYIFATTYTIVTILFMLASMVYCSIMGDIQSTSVNGLLLLGSIAMLSYVIDDWIKFKDKL